MTMPRQATTDAQGGFEFTGLAAGSYSIRVSPGQYSSQYLSMAYGAKRPNGPGGMDQGQPIQLQDGQTLSKIAINLPRGGVITGRVTDETSLPMARVQVYSVFFSRSNAKGTRSGNSTQTDDLGQFRLYGLMAGEYAVVAEARGNTFVAPNAPPETEEDKSGYVTTYYPGTADDSAAQRVRVSYGAETGGIEIRLVQGRLFRVTGMLKDSQGRAVARANGQLTRRNPGVNGYSSFGFSTDDQGLFQMRNVPPGSYRLIVRETRNVSGSPPAPSEPQEMASLPLTIESDLENLVVTTSVGATIKGQIFFEQGPPPAMPNELRVTAQAGNPEEGGMLPMPQPGIVTPQLTFTLQGLMGDYLLRTSAPRQTVKSVVVNGEDVTDVPHEFKMNDRVTITMTGRTATVEGTVTNAKGEPAALAPVMLFSEDKVSWRNNSVRLRRSTTDAQGLFRMMGLMPGRYYIVALARDQMMSPGDMGFFEELTKVATTITVSEDELRKIDLKAPDDEGL
jgi:protocatechuate 3,4-dioxygenase beta subunit